MTYLEAQVLFQDKIEPLLKNSGLQDYKFSSDIILNFLYEAEIESILDLCNKQEYDLLKNYIVVDEVTTIVLDTDAGYYTATSTDALHHIKSFCYNLTIAYPTLASTETKTTAKAQNELIPISDISKYITTSNRKVLFDSPKIALFASGLGTSEVQTGKFIIITDSYTVITGLSSVKITYVKRPYSPRDSSPNTMTYTSTLKADPRIVGNIIDLAVQKALSSVVPMKGTKE